MLVRGLYTPRGQGARRIVDLILFNVVWAARHNPQTAVSSGVRQRAAPTASADRFHRLPVDSVVVNPHQFVLRIVHDTYQNVRIVDLILINVV